MKLFSHLIKAIFKPLLGFAKFFVITLSELDWITNNQSEFSRLDMALVLKIGRLMDKGIIELDCRLPA